MSNEKKIKYFYEFDVHKFIEEIQLSKKRRPQYYKRNCKLPKKYSDYDAFIYGKDDVLVEVETGTKVIKNSRAVGTPNIKKINGQYFWTGANPHIRRKIKREMSEFFLKYMENIPVVKKDQYPIGVRIDLYDVVDRGSDLDNFIYLYRKVLHDVLTANEMDHKAIIIDDSKIYIQDIPTKFYPIDSHDDRKLHIEIYSL